MTNSPLTLHRALEQVIAFVSSGTIAQMRLDKSSEVLIRNDGARAFLDINKKVEHHPIKLSKVENTQSS